MLKYYVTALMLLMSIGASGQAFCQEAQITWQPRTVSGKIIKIDAESGVISVKTSHGEVVFQIVSVSNLYLSTHHMSVIELEKGDPVMIVYATVSGKNNVIRLVDNRENG